ncbi:hypothetical protein [Saccharopolyspora sp. ASAGF58]|uniref:hypothetical protein n=1 Tax=Saccharopolyspora sp. ASAGF58 TaxID=2719023 RepID=UPI001B30D856|nr:hypothetical protein [Saccharopolyspora sp. ASAGF58]
MVALIPERAALIWPFDLVGGAVEIEHDAVVVDAQGVGFHKSVHGLRPAYFGVRGWLRRFAGRVEAVRSVFTVWLRALDADPVMPEPGGSGWVDALRAIEAAAVAAVGGS